MASTLSNLIYHIVFSTKRREPTIHSFRDELYRYITGIIKREGGYLISIGGMPDHVHIVLKLIPRQSISVIMKKIKGNSSKWINEKNKARGHFSWQAGYGVFSVSQSQLASVINYIGTQEERHKTRTYQEEYINFL